MFYVYTLADPRTGAPFYVGKGCRDRISAHEAEARKGRVSRKCDKIREIWFAGLTVQKAIVSRYSDEGEAYAAEAAMIDEIGLRNLTNVVPGVGGRTSSPQRRCEAWTVEMVRRIKPGLKRSLAARRNGDGRLYACGLDITAILFGLLRQLVRDVGANALRAELAN